MLAISWRLLVLSVFGAAIITLLTSVLRTKKLPKGTKPLPGPKGLPIAGNAFDIPKSHAWFKFKEWADEYGPIYQVRAFGVTMVLISSESIANELLGLRGAIYSDRPALIMPKLIADNGFLGAIGWTDWWRRARKFAQSMLSTQIIQQTLPKQTIEARQMVVDLAKDSTKYEYWLERAGVMNSIKQIYGLSEERGPAEEHHVRQITSFMENIDRVATPGQYLVELIPQLMYLPTWLAPFKQEAKNLVNRHWTYLEPLMAQQSGKFEANIAEYPESTVRRFLKNRKDWDLSDRELVWVAASIFGGASGTSATAMQSIIFNTLLFPEWQKRMQEEIDDVVGDDRLPNFDDYGSMPRVRAVIKETMRWRPVLSGGFPHAVTKDDVFDGYHIPQGAVIIPNQWAIFRDATMYPEAESFKPERWLQASYPTYQEPLTTYPNLKRFAAFGHGRRICPGLEVAEKALFLQVTSLYWACTVKKDRDANGKEIDVPWYEYTGVAISTPHKFRFAVEKRSEHRFKLMEETALKDHEQMMAEMA